MTRGRGRRRPGQWLLPLTGAVAAAATWFLLVRLAVSFGGEARAGTDIAWLYLALASVGAVVAALGVLVLARVALVGLGLVREYVPRRARP